MILTFEEYSKIKCKICSKIINYFIVINEFSTNNMIKYLKTITCKKRKRSNSFTQIVIIFDRINLI